MRLQWDLSHVKKGLGLAEEGLTHRDDVSNDSIAKCDITSNGDQGIDGGGRANTEADDTNDTRRGVVVEFVQNGEHLTGQQA
jgi:hypothetical protein